MRRRKPKLPKWKYAFSCRDCRHVQFIKDEAKGREGDYCVKSIERADAGLAGKVLIHRYDAYSTNSVYLKFDYGVANSLRIADHAGKEHLAYRFNIILNLTEPKNDLSGRFPRNYYPPDMVDQVIEDILAGVEAKRARYRDYEKTVADARDRVTHERGFWQQARLVNKREVKDNDHI